MGDSGKPRIGFIGLGPMGSAMVERLQQLGYPMTVIAHRNRKPIEAAVARGAVEAAGPGALAADSDIVMLPKQAFGLAKAQGWGDRMVPEMVDYFAHTFAGGKP